MNALSVAVLIRTKNEAAHIAKTLELVSSQSLTPTEIIVVDSGSTDGTVEIVQQWPDVQLIQIRPEAFTFGSSLNLGIEAAKSDIVVSLSAHAYPASKDWLAHFTKHFTNQNVAGVYGRQLAHDDAWPPVQREYISYYTDEGRIQHDPDDPSHRVFSNANSAIRRQLITQFPFDETLTAVEDQDWAWRMLKAGHQIIYEPEASAYHSHNETLKQVFHRNLRETIALNQMYDREVSVWRALKIWCKSVYFDIKYIVVSTKNYRWILKVPVYRIATVIGCLFPSSLSGLLRLPSSITEFMKEIFTQEKNIQS